MILEVVDANRQLKPPPPPPLSLPFAMNVEVGLQLIEKECLWCF